VSVLFLKTLKIADANKILFVARNSSKGILNGKIIEFVNVLKLEFLIFIDINQLYKKLEQAIN